HHVRAHAVAVLGPGEGVHGGTVRRAEAADRPDVGRGGRGQSGERRAGERAAGRWYRVRRGDDRPGRPVPVLDLRVPVTAAAGGPDVVRGGVEDRGEDRVGGTGVGWGGSVGQPVEVHGAGVRVGGDGTGLF